VVNVGTNAAGHIPTAQLPMLEQNAPNPFHGSTHIRFVTVAAGQVSLTVHDLLGRTMASLVDQRLEPGRHEVRFDVAQLPAGTYLYHLSSNGRQLCRQMVLLP
jgi:serine protease AprX